MLLQTYVFRFPIAYPSGDTMDAAIGVFFVFFGILVIYYVVKFLITTILGG